MIGKIDLRIDEDNNATLLTLVYPIIEQEVSILKAAAAFTVFFVAFGSIYYIFFF